MSTSAPSVGVSGSVGVKTSTGLAIWLAVCVGLLFLAHFTGLRVLFTAGRSVG
jgi:hypothetical protein